MDKKSRIPKDLKANIKRMEEILAKEERDLANLRTQHQDSRDQEEAALAAAAEERAKGEEADMDLVAEKELMSRKYGFDRRYFGRKIKELKGKIAWARDRQIPFLKEELAHQPLTQQPFVAALGETPQE